MGEYERKLVLLLGSHKAIDLDRVLVASGIV